MLIWYTSPRVLVGSSDVFLKFALEEVGLSLVKSYLTYVKWWKEDSGVQ